MGMATGVFKARCQECLPRHILKAGHGDIDVERAARLHGVHLHRNATNQGVRHALPGENFRHQPQRSLL